MISEMLYFMASYLIIIVVLLGLLQFLSNGFFFKFFKVKISRGKKTLIKVNAVTHSYYVPGKITSSTLKFIDQAGEERLLTDIKKSSIYRSIGVNCIDYDEVTDSIIDPNTGEHISSSDPVKTEGLYVRALTGPKIKNPKELMKIVVFAILIVGALAFLIILSLQMSDGIEALKTSVEALKSTGVVQ